MLDNLILWIKTAHWWNPESLQKVFVYYVLQKVSQHHKLEKMKCLVESSTTSMTLSVCGLIIWKFIYIQSRHTSSQNILKTGTSLVYRVRLGYSVQQHFSYISYIVAVSFIGGGNQSTRKKLQTCCKSLTIFIT